MFYLLYPETDIRGLGADDFLSKPFTSDELLNSIVTRFEKQEAIIQQYGSEIEKTTLLQRKLEELQQSVDTKDKLFQKTQQELRYFLSKVNMALNVLKHTSEGTKSDHCVHLLQEACNGEMALLNQMPSLLDFLTPENAKLLRELNIVSSQPEEIDLVLGDEEVSEISFPF